MARATRSTKQQTKEPELTPPPAKVKGAKKRKRTSLADPDGQPAAKLSRTASEDVEQPKEEDPQTEDAPAAPVRPSVGDLPIDPDDAAKILDVLEMIDTQGLLERVFPLPPDESVATTSSSSQTAQSVSFRTLLQESAHYSLRILRSAVQNLFPISSQPRSRPSAAAAQQQRFCDLALALLDQVSGRSAPLPPDFDAISPSAPGEELYTDGDDAKPSEPKDAGGAPRNIRYALLQRLPTGDWWSSLNSAHADAASTALRALPTAHAELVAVLPTPSAAPEPAGPVPTLGALVKPRAAPPRTAPARLFGPRVMSAGAFAARGPYASFAPAYEGGAVEVGADALREVLWERQRQKRVREAVEAKRRAWLAARERMQIAPAASATEGEEDAMDVEVEATSGNDATKGKAKMQDIDVDTALEGLLSDDQVAAIKATLGNLELERMVQELLDRNARALQRLELLQMARLSDPNGGKSKVQEGSEEWNTAQGILDSLTLLTSMRPRASTSEDASPAPTPSLIPPASVLRTLQRTLPTNSSQGWYGTLPPTRPKAVRDDNTLLLKPGAVLPATAAASTSRRGSASPAPAAAPQAYAPYAYNAANTAYGAQYRGGAYPYNPAAAGMDHHYRASSYQQAAGQTPTAVAAAAAAAGTAHYPAHQQYTASGQTQYPYAASSWYSYQQQQGGASSGQASPAPTTTPAAMPTSYAGFFGAGAQAAPQPAQAAQRAVANTVVANKNYQPAAWGAAGATQAGYPGATPTLPPHLRQAPGYGQAATPGTPGGYQYPQYAYPAAR